MLDKLDDNSLTFLKGPVSFSKEEEYCSRFSDLETFGIKPYEEISPILEDFNHRTIFNDETGRYQVSLPFINKMKDKLGNNFINSKVRLDSLFRTKINNPNETDFAQKYYDIIMEQEQLGIIERVSNIPGSENHNKGHYIPHHGVMKDGSPKLRVVMDGSADTETGVCLNDCLSPGPPLTNELIEMIMRFRTHEYIITGDIEKAFLQMEVSTTKMVHLSFTVLCGYLLD